MDVCLSLALGATVLRLASPVTLAWQHSVEHFAIEEEWQAGDTGLVLRETRVAGLGAGVDLPPDAHWAGGFWHFTPGLPPQREVHLANSRHVAGYRVCSGGACTALEPGPAVTMTSCGR